MRGKRYCRLRRLFLIFNLLFITFFAYSQQNLPARIIGGIPDSSDAKLYQIQVGAYLLESNAENALFNLRDCNFSPVTEKYQNFTRVIIKRIPASQVRNYLANIKLAGFNEVIIREDTNNSISEKWEINNPESAYTSFEFNHDMNYVAVENDENKTNRFGEYYISESQIINLINLGVLKINNNDEGSVDFSFSSADEPEKTINLSAAKSDKITASAELDLFCRTWKVVYCTDEESIGNILFISNAGTYFFTTPDGEANSMSRWRWYDDSKKEFEYSHDNWMFYGRARIDELTINSLKVFDPGYRGDIPGYSSAGFQNHWEFVPVR